MNKYLKVQTPEQLPPLVLKHSSDPVLRIYETTAFYSVLKTLLHIETHYMGSTVATAECSGTCTKRLERKKMHALPCFLLSIKPCCDSTALWWETAPSELCW